MDLNDIRDKALVICRYINSIITLCEEVKREMNDVELITHILGNVFELIPKPIEPTGEERTALSYFDLSIPYDGTEESREADKHFDEVNQILITAEQIMHGKNNN